MTTELDLHPVKQSTHTVSDPPLVVQLRADSTPRGMASIEMAITSRIRPYTEAVVREGGTGKGNPET